MDQDLRTYAWVCVLCAFKSTCLYTLRLWQFKTRETSFPHQGQGARRTYACAHVHVPTYICTGAGRYICTRTCERVMVHMCMYMCTCAGTCVHVHVHVWRYMCARTCARVQEHVCRCMCTCAGTCVPNMWTCAPTCARCPAQCLSSMTVFPWEQVLWPRPDGLTLESRSMTRISTWPYVLYHVPECICRDLH